MSTPSTVATTSLVATTIDTPQMTFNWQAEYLGEGQVKVFCYFGGGSDHSNHASAVVTALTPGTWPCGSTPVDFYGTNPNIGPIGTVSAYWFDTYADDFKKGSQPGYIVWFNGNMVYPNVNDVAGGILVAFCDVSNVSTAV